MLLEVIEECVGFLFRHGFIACLGRLALLALYMAALISIDWGNSVGPLLALIFAGVLLRCVGYRRLVGFLLQPDIGVCEAWGRAPWGGICAGLVLSLGLYGPFVIALMYNLPFHGAWMIPLPTVVMALQTLLGRRRKRAQSHPVDPPDLVWSPTASGHGV